MEHDPPITNLANEKNMPSINRLPLEILSTIFLDMQPGKRLRYGLPFEVAMSHVCRHWRDIALASPLLWRNIDVYSSRSLDAIYSYLKRSKGCLVNVRLDVWQSDRDWNLRDGATSIVPLIDLLNKHATRWKTLLVFTYRRDTTDVILLRMKDLAAPFLERLYIMDDYIEVDRHGLMSDRTFPTNPQFLVGGVPRLVVVHTNNLRQPPPLANVTTLHLRTSTSFSSFDIHTDVLSDLAVACPSLTTLSIHGSFLGNWVVEKVTMPNLRSLWLSNKDLLAAKFLTTVGLPNLNSLWLQCPQSQVIDIVYNYRPRPSFPSLKYLTLQDFDYYATSKFSHVFPTIEGLHLAYFSAFHITFLKQTLIENDMIRWQNLQTLAFRTTQEFYAVIFSKVLNELLAERGAGGRPVLRVLMDSDLLAALTTEDSVRTHTSLEELCVDNYDDPLWILTHGDEGNWL